MRFLVLKNNGKKIFSDTHLLFDNLWARLMRDEPSRKTCPLYPQKKDKMKKRLEKIVTVEIKKSIMTEEKLLLIIDAIEKEVPWIVSQSSK